MFEDQDELEALKKRYQDKFLAGQLQDSPNPYADLGLKLAGGGIDLLSRNAAAQLDPVATLTGHNVRAQQTTNAGAQVQQALAARDTMARQKALDDQNAIGQIQKMIEAKKQAEYAAQKQPLELAKLKAETEALGPQKELDRAYKMAQIESLKTRPDKQSKQNQDLEINLRKEYQSLDATKDTQKVASAYEKVKKAAENPSAAGDLSLIFGYMKMLDPGSTVREGEFANAQNAAGVPDQIINAYNRAKNGQRLNENQRADFLGQAENIYVAQLQNQKQFDDQYKELAAQYGANPKNIIREYKIAEKKPAQSNKPKTVVQNGHVYTLNEKTGDYE